MLLVPKKWRGLEPFFVITIIINVILLLIPLIQPGEVNEVVVGVTALIDP
jgi:hypothetical protein